MKRTFYSKLLSSKKLLGRVLRKSKSRKQIGMSEEEIALSKDVDALKDQIENLGAAIRTLQAEADKKDIAIDRLVKDKEKVTCELLKQRRSNKHLTKQLEDERKFYFREKENYCHEMNEYKKLKACLSASNVGTDKKSPSDYQTEIVNLKRMMSQTLTTNYNLSIKFLRMKNTKSFLKHELHKVKAEHEKIVGDLKGRLETITSETRDALELKIETSISPSSKKYLQVVKQNSSLMYENLCLQLEIDRLNLKMDKLRLYKTKSETNSRLRYLRDEYCPRKLDKHNSKLRKSETNKIKCDTIETNKRAEARLIKQEEKVIKIFERLESPAVPVINTLPEKKNKEKTERRKEHKKSRRKQSMEHDESNKPTKDEGSCSRTEERENKAATLKVSESQTSSDLKTSLSVLSARVVDTQSAPDIVQSTPPEKCDENKDVVLVNKI